MTGKDELNNFKKMWTWLIGHPAHDRQYFMEHVAKLDKMWPNSCPLANSNKEGDCTGCKMLWKSERGTLCTDSDAPLYKWQTTDRQLPDDRSYYASQIAVLAMRLAHDLEQRVTH